MIFKNANKKHIITESSGLSRIWQYTHNPINFAIIGTQDKDTKEDRKSELESLIRELMDNQVNSLKNKPDGTKMITYKKLIGNYIYDSGEPGEEYSFLINNISKEDALRLGRAVNQESILWKDDDFFGYIYCEDGRPDMQFSREDRNMGFNPEDVNAFGSRLISKHNKGQGFTFKAESLKPMKVHGTRQTENGKVKMVREELFRIRFN